MADIKVIPIPLSHPIYLQFKYISIVFHIDASLKISLLYLARQFCRLKSCETESESRRRRNIRRHRSNTVPLWRLAAVNASLSSASIAYPEIDTNCGDEVSAEEEAVPETHEQARLPDTGVAK